MADILPMDDLDRDHSFPSQAYLCGASTESIPTATYDGRPFVEMSSTLSRSSKKKSKCCRVKTFCVAFLALLILALICISTVILYLLINQRGQFSNVEDELHGIRILLEQSPNIRQPQNAETDRPGIVYSTSFSESNPQVRIEDIVGIKSSPPSEIYRGEGYFEHLFQEIVIMKESLLDIYHEIKSLGLRIDAKSNSFDKPDSVDPLEIELTPAMTRIISSTTTTITTSPFVEETSNLMGKPTITVALQGSLNEEAKVATKKAVGALSKWVTKTPEIVYDSNESLPIVQYSSTAATTNFARNDEVPLGSTQSPLHSQTTHDYSLSVTPSVLVNGTSTTASVTHSRTTQKNNEETDSTTEPDRDIATGWYLAENGLYYKFVKVASSYMVAKRKCGLLGSRLASTGIRNNKLKKLLFDISGGFQFWIGLDELENKGHWLWGDGVESPQNELDWEAGQPNDGDSKIRQDCVEMIFPDAKFNDEACILKQFFMCEKE